MEHHPHMEVEILSAIYRRKLSTLYLCVCQSKMPLGHAFYPPSGGTNGSITDLVFDRNSFMDRKGLGSVNIVDHVLMHHVGPIRKFSLDLFMSLGGIDQYYSHINRRIVFLSRNGIKELLLSDMPLGSISYQVVSFPVKNCVICSFWV